MKTKVRKLSPAQKRLQKLGIEDVSDYTPYEAMAKLEDSMKALTLRERQIIRAIYGLDEHQGTASIHDLKKRFQLSEQEINSYRTSAEAKMKRKLGLQTAS